MATALMELNAVHTEGALRVAPSLTIALMTSTRNTWQIRLMPAGLPKTNEWQFRGKPDWLTGFPFCKARRVIGFGMAVVPLSISEQSTLIAVCRRCMICAFAECSTLATLEIPRSVISIARHAFFRCESLQVIRMSASSNLSLIGRAAFLDCPSLTEIDVGAMAVNLWPRLLRQLDSPTGLFGNHTCIDQENRTTFVLSFLTKHVAQFCGGGTTGRGRWVIRRTPPVLRN
jgi:hypothetical protein